MTMLLSFIIPLFRKGFGLHLSAIAIGFRLCLLDRIFRELSK